MNIISAVHLPDPQFLARYTEYKELMNARFSEMYVAFKFDNIMTKDDDACRQMSLRVVDLWDLEAVHKVRHTRGRRGLIKCDSL